MTDADQNIQIFKKYIFGLIAAKILFPTLLYFSHFNFCHSDPYFAQYWRITHIQKIKHFSIFLMVYETFTSAPKQRFERTKRVIDLISALSQKLKWPTLRASTRIATATVFPAWESMIISASEPYDSFNYNFILLSW